MFFALSGFLVTGSALRTGRLVPFLGLRVLRLLPALFVEVTLSAIILGGIFTQSAIIAILRFIDVLELLFEHNWGCSSLSSRSVH